MRSINHVTLLGNLTRDVELKYTQNNSAVCKFGLATNRSYKDKTTGEWKELPQFHNVVFWGKQAEKLSQFVKKGDKLYLEGRIETSTWQDDQGNTRKNTEIVGEDFSLWGKRAISEIAPAQAPVPAPVPAQAEITPDEAEEVKGEKMSGKEVKDINDDIPF